MNPKSGKYPKLTEMKYIPMTAIEQKYLSRRKTPLELDRQEEENASTVLLFLFLIALICGLVYVVIDKWIVPEPAHAEEVGFVIETAEYHDNQYYCDRLGEYEHSEEITTYCSGI